MRRFSVLCLNAGIVVTLSRQLALRGILEELGLEVEE